MAIRAVLGSQKELLGSTVHLVTGLWWRLLAYTVSDD